MTWQNIIFIRITCLLLQPWLVLSCVASMIISWYICHRIGFIFWIQLRFQIIIFHFNIGLRHSGMFSLHNWVPFFKKKISESFVAHFHDCGLNRIIYSKNLRAKKHLNFSCLYDILNVKLMFEVLMLLALILSE